MISRSHTKNKLLHANSHTIENEPLKKKKELSYAWGIVLGDNCSQFTKFS